MQIEIIINRFMCGVNESNHKIIIKAQITNDPEKEADESGIIDVSRVQRRERCVGSDRGVLIQ